MEKRRKDCRAILTAMFPGTCVPAKEEMHFIQAIGKKAGLKRGQELVNKKNKWDGKFQWVLKQIIASNGRIIYP